MTINWTAVTTGAVIAFLIAIMWPTKVTIPMCSITKTDRLQDPIFRPWNNEPRKEMAL